MLTDTPVQVLAAINDYCELLGSMELDHEQRPLPDLLADLRLPDDEVYIAVSDLYELGLIRGVSVAERPYPVRVDGLTAKGRQRLRFERGTESVGRRAPREHPHLSCPDDPTTGFISDY